MPQTFILPILLTPDIGITLVFIHEVVVRAGQLPLKLSWLEHRAPESQGRRFDSRQRAYSEGVDGVYHES